MKNISAILVFALLALSLACARTGDWRYQVSAKTIVEGLSKGKFIVNDGEYAAANPAHGGIAPVGSEFAKPDDPQDPGLVYPGKYRMGKLDVTIERNAGKENSYGFVCEGWGSDECFQKGNRIICPDTEALRDYDELTPDILESNHAVITQISPKKVDVHVPGIILLHWNGNHYEDVDGVYTRK